MGMGARERCLLLLFLLVAVSCEVTPPARVNQIYREIVAQRESHYKLTEGDSITVRLYNRPGDLNQEDFPVLPDGHADLFLSGNVKLEGKTVDEADAEIARSVAAEVPDPEVSLEVTPRQEIVYMVGQFERPGVVPLRTRMTMRQAIAAAGGLRITGDSDWALLRRPFANPRRPDLFRVDLNDESDEIVLLPNDQIVLGRNIPAFISNWLQEYIFSIAGNPEALFILALAAF